MARPAKGPVEAAAGASRLDVLVATRDRLARALDRVEDRYAASLAKQLAETVREIESIKPQEVSAVDDLAARRSARRGPAKSARSAPVRKSGSRARSGGAGGKRGTGS